MALRGGAADATGQVQFSASSASDRVKSDVGLGRHKPVNVTLLKRLGACGNSRPRLFFLMADYLYLLQNRLTQAQRRAAEAVREAARARTMPVFLVGGAVRDLSSGAPVRDLDFAVQGDVAELVTDLEQGGAVVAGRNPVLASVYLLFPGGVRVEVGPTLTVTYPKPGQPETRSAPILDDLRRRDFTANAMAISLNEGSYGLLLDPLNGIADMENHELRLVSAYGFIEQPALLLRAARLSARLGWTFEQRTGTRYQNAKEEGTIDGLAAWDRGYETEELFHEEDVLFAFDHLSAEGWAAALDMPWTPAKADKDGMERVRDLAGQMEQIGVHTDPSPVLFPLLTAKLSSEELAALKASFPRQGFVQQVDTLEARSKELAGQLTGKHAGSPSEIWKMLFAAEPEVVLALASTSRSTAIQSKFKLFLNEWPPLRQRIPYALMQEMRITPEMPGYEQLLQELFFALIDGKLSTTEATRAFLEPYSPPAPVQQAAPRRRPAKATRSRSRKAAGKAVEPDTDEVDDLAEEIPEVALPEIDAAVDDAELDAALDKDSDTDLDTDTDVDLDADLDTSLDADDEAGQESSDAEPAVVPPAAAVAVPQTKAKSAKVVGIPAKPPFKTTAKKEAGEPTPAPVAAHERIATPINASATAKTAAKAAAPAASTVAGGAAPKRTADLVEKTSGKAAGKIPEKAAIPAIKGKAAAQQVVVIAKPQPAKAQPAKAVATKGAALKTAPAPANAAAKKEATDAPSKTAVAKLSAKEAATSKEAAASKIAAASKTAASQAESPKGSARPVVVVPPKAAGDKRGVPVKAAKTAPTKGRSGR